MTKDEKIAELEKQCSELGTKSMSTTSGAYGTAPKAVKNMEMFSMTHNNIQKDPDLMPCPRRPPNPNVNSCPRAVTTMEWKAPAATVTARSAANAPIRLGVS